MTLVLTASIMYWSLKRPGARFQASQPETEAPSDSAGASADGEAEDLPSSEDPNEA